MLEAVITTNNNLTWFLKTFVKCYFFLEISPASESVRKGQREIIGVRSKAELRKIPHFKDS